MPALTALAVILGDFLPILLANVPFRRASTFAAHTICSWAAVAVLGYMLAIIGALLATVFRPGVYGALPFELSALPAAAVPAVLAAGSPELLRRLEGVAGEPPAERERRLAGGRYRLVVGFEGDSTLRCGIEVEVVSQGRRGGR